MKIFLASLFTIFLFVPVSYGADHAVALLYHHVSSETPASTSISPELFRQQLDYLAAHDFTVLPLGQVLKTLAEGRQVPDRTVSITFDDAYRSVLVEALPLLKERNWPFTVFVNTESVDKGYGQTMTWEELGQILRAGGEIGNHGRRHGHLARRMPGESEEQWHERVRENISFAQKRLLEKLGVTAQMFAYPFGEHTRELRSLVAELGLFGIAQQSGAIGFGFNRQAVPRYPMATNYDDMQRFVNCVNSRPLPVADVSAGPEIQVAGQNSRYKLEFTLLPGEYSAEELACYSSSGEKLKFALSQTETGRHVSVRLPDWSAGRRKINCTAPSSHERGVYYWYSHLWLVTYPDGHWYQD